MNTLTKLTSLTTLALLGTAAQAELVCNNCEYIYDRGSYLGAFWPGDRATFGNRDIVADLDARLGPGMGHNRQFDDFWVFDLNANVGGTLTLGSKLVTALDPLWAIEIYADGGSTCDATRCTSIVLSPAIDGLKLVMSGFTRSFSTNMYALPAGRYVIRIAGGTRATGESAYHGALAIRRH